MKCDMNQLPMGSNTKKNLNICIVAHFAYGAMTGGASGHIGGVERQTSFMARWLAARGHKVSLITWDEGQDDGIEIDGVKVFRLCRRDEGIRFVRFIHPRWTSLNKALQRASAEVYYHNCAEYVTGQVALWSRRHSCKFVFSTAHDHDCMESLPGLKSIRERVLYRYGLRHGDRIIVQTWTQQRMLKDGFGLDSQIIPMPCPGPSEEDFVSPEPPHPATSRILWIARLTKQKRPDRFLDLAEMCPDLQFDLVGPGYNDVYSNMIIERARQIPNLTFHGAVVREKVPDLYKKAACLCSTSDHEGFPNTFLEAWSYGIPLITSFDPDQIVAGKGLGAVASDVPGLARSIRSLLVSPDLWKSASANARQYYVENHSIERVLPRFEEVFRDVLMT